MTIQPWYKQFWPWFLIILPLTVVTWTIITVIVFSKNSVSLVAEDYYKKGKGINVDLSRIKVAQELGLNAYLSSDNEAITIAFDKGTLTHYPALHATFTHRTLPDRDFNRLLTADAQGNYRFKHTTALQGPWFVSLTSHDKQWMVQGRISFPANTIILME